MHNITAVRTESIAPPPKMSVPDSAAPAHGYVSDSSGVGSQPASPRETLQSVMGQMGLFSFIQAGADAESRSRSRSPESPALEASDTSAQPPAASFFGYTAADPPCVTRRCCNCLRALPAALAVAAVAVILGASWGHILIGTAPGCDNGTQQHLQWASGAALRRAVGRGGGQPKEALVDSVDRILKMLPPEALAGATIRIAYVGGVPKEFASAVQEASTRAEGSGARIDATFVGYLADRDEITTEVDGARRELLCERIRAIADAQTEEDMPYWWPHSGARAVDACRALWIASGGEDPCGGEEEVNTTREGYSWVSAYTEGGEAVAAQALSMGLAGPHRGFDVVVLGTPINSFALRGSLGTALRAIAWALSTPGDDSTTTTTAVAKRKKQGGEGSASWLSTLLWGGKKNQGLRLGGIATFVHIHSSDPTAHPPPWIFSEYSGTHHWMGLQVRNMFFLL